MYPEYVETVHPVYETRFDIHTTHRVGGEVVVPYNFLRDDKSKVNVMYEGVTPSSIYDGCGVISLGVLNNKVRGALLFKTPLRAWLM